MSLRRELARKLLHVSTAAVPVAYAAGMSRERVGAGLVALLAVAVVVELARRTVRGAAAFTRVTGHLLRAHEHAGRWAGATWLLLAFLLAVAAFPREVAVAAMLGVSLGDAAGAVVGRWWSERRAASALRGPMRGALRGPMHAAGGPRAMISHPVAAPPRGHVAADPAPALHHPHAPGIAGSPKTWAGSIACAAATTLGALAIARLAPGEALLAGLLAALAERPRWSFDDNMRIVLAVGSGILLSRFAFS